MASGKASLGRERGSHGHRGDKLRHLQHQFCDGDGLQDGYRGVWECCLV